MANTSDWKQLTLSDGRVIPYPSDIDMDTLRNDVSNFLLDEVKDYDATDFQSMNPARLEELRKAKEHQMGVVYEDMSPAEQEDAYLESLADPQFRMIHDATMEKKYEGAKMGVIATGRNIYRGVETVLNLGRNTMYNMTNGKMGLSDAELDEYMETVKKETEAFEATKIADTAEFTVGKVAADVAASVVPMAKAEQAVNGTMQLLSRVAFKNPRLAGGIIGRSVSSGIAGGGTLQVMEPLATEDRLDKFVQDGSTIMLGTAGLKLAQQLWQTGGPAGWWGWAKLNKALRQEHKITKEVADARNFSIAERDQMLKELNEIGVEGTGYRVSQKYSTSVGKEMDDILTSSTDGVDAVIVNEAKQMRNIAHEVDKLIPTGVPARARSDLGLGNKIKGRLRQAIAISDNVRKSAFTRIFGQDNPVLDDKIVNVTNLRQGMNALLKKYQSSLGGDMFKKLGKDIDGVVTRINESPFISIRQLQNDLAVFGEIAAGVGKNTNQRTRIALAKEIKKGLEKSLDDLIKRGPPIPHPQGRALGEQLQKAREVYRRESVLMDTLNRGVVNKLLSRKTKGVLPGERMDDIMNEAPEKLLKRFRGLPQSEQEVVVTALQNTVGGGRLTHAMKANAVDTALAASRTLKGPNGLRLVDPSKLADQLDDDLFKVLFKDDVSKESLKATTHALNTIIGRLGNMSRAAAGEVEQRLLLTGGSLLATGPASAGFAAALANKLYANLGSRMLLDSASREALIRAHTTKHLPTFLASLSIALDGAGEPNTIEEVSEFWRK